MGELAWMRVLVVGTGRVLPRCSYEVEHDNITGHQTIKMTRTAKESDIEMKKVEPNRLFCETPSGSRVPKFYVRRTT